MHKHSKITNYFRRGPLIWVGADSSQTKVIRSDNIPRLERIAKQLLRSKLAQCFKIRRAVYVKVVTNIVGFLSIRSCRPFRHRCVLVQFGSTERWNFLKTEQGFDSKRRQHY